MKPASLTAADYENASKLLGCDKTVIQAFAEVESSGYGFWQFSDTDWRPKILFEAYWFSQLTGGIYDKTHPEISSPVWNKSLYMYGKKEYNRLDEACSLNRSAGLQSASWGKFQIMGFNHVRCGFVNLHDFINAMYKSEAEHLKAFCAFVSADKKLIDAIRNHDFRIMALRYNGSGAVDIYSSRLQDIYKNLS